MKAFQKVFTASQENELAEYLKTRAKMCYGLGSKQIPIQAYHVASKKGIPTESWTVRKCAGKDWYFNFMRKHTDLSLRGTQMTCLGCSQCFNTNAVGTFFFFKISKNYISKTNILRMVPESIILMKLLLTPFQLHRSRLSQKGSKEVAQAGAAAKGTLVTACGIIIAVAGNFLPPAMVFPCVNFKKIWMDERRIFL